MATIDPAQEFQRLSDVYSRMADEQLVLVAADFAELTDVAQRALRAEFDKRRLPFPEPQAITTPARTNDEPEAAGEEEGEVETDDHQHVDVRALVELRRFRDLLDAEMAKGALDSAGIESFLSDDNMVRMDWFYSNAIGGVKLMIRPEDVGAAQHVLDQPIPESIEFAEGEHYEQPKCPTCGSRNVTYGNIEEGVAYTSAWLGIPIPYARSRWECQDCKATWKDEEEDAEDDPENE